MDSSPRHFPISEMTEKFVLDTSSDSDSDIDNDPTLRFLRSKGTASDSILSLTYTVSDLTGDEERGISSTFVRSTVTAVSENQEDDPATYRLQAKNEKMHSITPSESNLDSSGDIDRTVLLTNDEVKDPEQLQKLMTAYYKREGQKLSNQLTKVLNEPVQLTPERKVALQELETNLRSNMADTQCYPRIALINFTEEIHERIQDYVQVVHESYVAKQDYKNAPLSLGPSNLNIDAILLQCHEKTLSLVEKTIIATAFFKSKLVVILSLGLSYNQSTAFSEEVSAYCNSIYEVYFSIPKLIQHLSSKFGEQATLRRAMTMETNKILEPFRKQDKMKHFLTRAPLALIPFGVMTLNFASILKLVKLMMGKLGFKISKSTSKKAAKQGAVAGTTQFLLNSSSDVYQAAVLGTILTEFGASFANAGLAAAFSTLSAVDGIMLGSICVLTGAVSAMSDYMTRPALVENLGCYFAALQLAYILYPQMRPIEDSPPNI